MFTHRKSEVDFRTISLGFFSKNTPGEKNHATPTVRWFFSAVAKLACLGTFQETPRLF